MQRFLVVIASLIAFRESLAQSAAATSESLIGKCFAVVPASDSVLRRWKSPLFGRLEATSWRNYPGRRWLRVAVPVGVALDSATKRYAREANWRVDSDSVFLAFSTGFTVVTFALAATSSDTLHGLVNVWNDNGAITYPGGPVTLTFPPCSGLTVP